MARLVIFDDKVRGVELPDRQVLIGRSQKNDIPINDGLLSRKHCSIVPVGGGYRLLDLKSSNGTYLNGERIEKVDLTADDIIEIGQTVIVFLEDGVWNRGEALARLRNPLKAQELIARIKHPSRSGDVASKIPLSRIGPKPLDAGSLQKVRKGRRPRSSGLSWDPMKIEGFAEALEEFIAHRAVLVLLRSSAPLRKVVGEVLAEVVGQSARAKDPSRAGDLKEKIRAGLRARLEKAGAPPEAPLEKAAGSPSDGMAASAGGAAVGGTEPIGGGPPAPAQEKVDDGGAP